MDTPGKYTTEFFGIQEKYTEHKLKLVRNFLAENMHMSIFHNYSPRLALGFLALGFALQPVSYLLQSRQCSHPNPSNLDRYTHCQDWSARCGHLRNTEDIFSIVHGCPTFMCTHFYFMVHGCPTFMCGFF